MLVETEDLPEKPETPSPAHHSPIRVRSDLQERSEEHTSELQSLAYLVCRLLLEKKKTDHNVAMDGSTGLLMSSLLEKAMWLAPKVMRPLAFTHTWFLPVQPLSCKCRTLTPSRSG